VPAQTIRFRDMITVVMPAYNAEKYIAEAIESILNQTFQDFEFIIVNDGSTDNTLKIIQQYAPQDRRIRIVQIDHVGTGAAKNAGVEVAKSDWIAMMDADDISLPQRLEKQVQAAQKYPDVVVWGVKGYNINCAGNIISKRTFDNGPNTEEEFYTMQRQGKCVSVLNGTAFFKKEIFLKECGYNATFKVAEDSDLFDRMSDHGPVLTLPDALYLYRFHGSNSCLHNFVLLKTLLEYIKQRRQAKHCGAPPLSLEAFLQQQNKWDRLKFYYVTLGHFYRHNTLMYYGEKRYWRMIFSLLFATMLQPQALILGLRKHLFPSKAH